MRTVESGWLARREKLLPDPKKNPPDSYAGYLKKTTQKLGTMTKKFVCTTENRVESVDWKGVGKYLNKSGNQVLLGNYTDDVTALGTAAQIATGIFDLDLPGDVRDISADFVNWEWSWGHLGSTLLDIVGVLPVIGVVKYADEVGTLVKGAKKSYDAAIDVGKNADELRAIGKNADEIAAEVRKTDFYVTPDGDAIPASQFNNTGRGLCFVAGTLILTRMGDRAIEDIRAGDEVLAENPETGEVTYKKVVRTFVNESEVLIHVTVGEETVVTTPTHPFYVEGRGWVAAGELAVGDSLRQSDGGTAVVKAIETEQLDEPIKVYNFEVEGFHTYFVGESGVLVHNMCAAGNIKSIGSNKRANEIAEQLGFEANGSMSPAEVLKSDYVDEGSYFDIMKNTQTNEIILKSKDGALVETGLILPK